MMCMFLLSAASESPSERLPARRHGWFGLPRQRPSLGLKAPDVPRALQALASASRYSLDLLLDVSVGKTELTFAACVRKGNFLEEVEGHTGQYKGVCGTDSQNLLETGAVTVHYVLETA